MERAQLSAFTLLRAVSSHSETEVELPIFFGRLSETVAELVRAGRVAFWRLGPDSTLSVQPSPYGFAADSPVHRLRIPLTQDADDIAHQLVAAGLKGIRSSIAVSWRDGDDRPIGALAAYDSRRGFSADDIWVLRIAAMAAGLMWRYRDAEQKLGATVERLEQEATTRRQLLGNIASGGDEARRRFASSLHDDSLQSLTAAELQLARLRDEVDPAKRDEQLDQLERTVKQVEDSLRRLLSNVSAPSAELPLGLDEAIRSRLEALRSNAGIELDVDVRLPELPDAAASIVLRNVSEALTNVEKHAHATAIHLSAHAADGGVRVVVVDDGMGFIVAESANVPGHLGLVAIRERAQLAGGRCHIESDPGAGTRVEFWIPINQ